jgi:transitional endoplasmic reticulum ATPase
MVEKTNVVVTDEKNKVNWDRLDVPIEHSGRAITLPGDPGKMPTEKAIEALQRKLADESQPFKVHEIIDAYPLDAAVAFVKAMTKLYGWASPQTVMTMFGPKPPEMISVKTGFKDEDVIQCPMGAFKLPGIDQKVHTSIENTGPRKVEFVIQALIMKKDKHLLLELATETRRIVKEQSIYRGKAIRLSVDDCGDLNTFNPPQFLNVSDTSEASLVFDRDIQAQIDTSILVPIKHTKDCRKQKVPLKRGVLLEGPYGTGKSLTARMTANVCEQNGWTFVLLDKVQGLRAALEFANRYAPAVVFAEDIDRIMEERDESANDLINTIDGVVSKNAEIMTILTTNHVEKIQPVILRPGRLDAVISLRAPSQEAVERLLRAYAGVLLPASAKVAVAAKELSGQIPATIRECVERAKLGMIGRGDQVLVDEDLVIAAQTMKAHLALLNRDTKKESDADKLANSLRAVVHPTADGNERLESLYSLTDNIDDRTIEIRRTVRDTKAMVEEAVEKLN